VNPQKCLARSRPSTKPRRASAGAYADGSASAPHELGHSGMGQSLAERTRMRLLALIGSGRALGNTEIMVTAIARAVVAHDERIDVRVLRLTDVKLNYCNGCMACAAEEPVPCPLDDDMEFLMSEYAAADGLILGAPAYTLLPPGPLKLISDRLILQLSRSDWGAPKPAVTVGVAGLPRWSELLVPLLNCTVLAQGFRVVDSFLAYGSGPGEVLLDPGNAARAALAGERLHRALGGEELPMPVPPGCCPVCGGDFFRLTERGIECPLCLVEGKLTGGVPEFEPQPVNRWQTSALQCHYTEWIQGSLERYLDRRPEVRQLVRPYRKQGFTLVKPPRSEPTSRDPSLA